MKNNGITYKKSLVYNTIFLQNLKSSFVFKPFWILSILWIVAEIIMVILTSTLSSQNTIDLLKNLKQMWMINFIINALFISFLAIFINYYLFTKQKTNGMHNLEIRFGVKLKYVFFIRAAIYLTLMICLLTIIFLLNIILFYGIGTINTNLLWTRFMVVFAFAYLYVFLSGMFMILIFSFLKQTIAGVLGMGLSILFAMSPFLTMVNYSQISSNYNVLKDYQKTTRVNARLALSEKWNKLVESGDKDAKVFDTGIINEMIDVYNDNDKGDEDDNLQPWYNSGDVNMVFTGIRTADLIGTTGNGEIDPIMGTPDTLNYFITSHPKTLPIWNKMADFEKRMADVSVGKWEDYKGDYSAFSIEKKINNSLSISSYVNYLLNTEEFKGDTQYNGILNYVKSIGDDLVLYNEISDNYSHQIGDLRGEIFKYSTAQISAKDFNDIYHSDLPRVITWIVMSSISYNNFIDGGEAEVLENNYQHNSTTTINRSINPFSNLMSMGQGEQFNNYEFDDVWNTSQNSITNFPNHYYSFNMPSDIVKHHIEDLGPNDYPLGNGGNYFEGHQISRLQLKLHQNSSLVATYICYYLVSFLFLILGYYSYRTNIIK